MGKDGILALFILNHCATSRVIAGADPGQAGHVVANIQGPLHRALH